MRFPMIATRTVLGVAVLFSSAGMAAEVADAEEDSSSSYGVDVSFPIHHRVSTNYAWLPHNTNSSVATPVEYQDMPIQPLGNRQQVYVSHLDACRKHFGDNANQCDVYEYDRQLMSLRQPQSMQNYTKIGFEKRTTPANVFSLIQRFWEQNQYNQVMEKWPAGNTYTNSWSSPTYMVSVDDKGLRGSGSSLKAQIWDAARTTIEDWTEEDLSPTSLYGIRVYTEGAILLPHVDRLPLVASAIVSVAQEVDEPWPMEIYNHDGIAHNVTLAPGEMLLFESHSCLHGRPWPLKGKYAAFMFIHFEPTGHSLRHFSENPTVDVDLQYKQATKDGVGGQSASNSGLPPYITRESPEEAHWRKLHPEGWRQPARSAGAARRDDANVNAHRAASSGDVETLKEEISVKKEIVSERDENGWQPLHEAARHGHKAAIEVLLSNGADINARTHGGRGGTALYIASKRFGAFHPVVQYLKNLGALSVPPDRSEL